MFMYEKYLSDIFQWVKKKISNATTLSMAKKIRRDYQSGHYRVYEFNQYSLW
ncbi:Uncharacterised protein [Salmonella enterica]|nr:hypothetical protein ZV79_4372 [Salmonella enterica subsp. enterica serovar Typhimurium]ELO64738.1 hypothetical protein SEEE1616_17244 [Salmonella enterica subsp. enterica serovar Enteritidis str. 648901 16-16]ESH90568.1 hypothetical protein SEEA1822_18439 [Salmonella enterica subsp. enterica serovar Agona str. 632182-2]CAH2822867.1 hypothetical protein SENBN720500_27430 [Salmonella enterica subsp. enterica]SUF48949.1 Uncharacterised protein [Salmonella enterica]